ncbi:TetR/AcrR family transcriptional regulator [Pseudorhodoplanes sp.]|uniref:TetR/AcrR family transcriptional regulator n=1 Tax=Pseudorhodoplanes sp. TaxID=1934341 RepID=UPI002BD41928|nr:TetR/AcrR family transcriptional regulator [Pseudorhodoplanes sp.]HWV54635.1 TetR/AcrR family transcriptional regulator [Pseudorhodoplanes sp.]
MKRRRSRAAAGDARDTILDSAERVFALHGYDGASMRMIALGAGVAQALLHYHFSTKGKLYEAMFERRAGVINAFREKRLEELLAGPKPPTLEALIDVLLQPSPAWLGSEAQSGEYFASVVGAVSIASDARSKKLMKRYYDPIAMRFIIAFMQVVPGLKKKDAVWAYLFALGARLQMSSSNERSMRLGGMRGLPKAANVQRDYIRFVAHGIRGIAYGADAKL